MDARQAKGQFFLSYHTKRSIRVPGLVGVHWKGECLRHVRYTVQKNDVRWRPTQRRAGTMCTHARGCLQLASPLCVVDTASMDNRYDTILVSTIAHGVTWNVCVTTIRSEKSISTTVATRQRLYVEHAKHDPPTANSVLP